MLLRRQKSRFGLKQARRDVVRRVEAKPIENKAGIACCHVTSPNICHGNSIHTSFVCTPLSSFSSLQYHPAQSSHLMPSTYTLTIPRRPSRSPSHPASSAATLHHVPTSSHERSPRSFIHLPPNPHTDCSPPPQISSHPAAATVIP